MKRALVLMLGLLGCANEIETGQHDNELAVLLESEPVGDPADVLAACLEIPQPITAAWIADRLGYHVGCYNSWAVSVDVVDSPIGGRIVNGQVAVAGDAMAMVPRTGFLIRARAAAAALVDLAAVSNGGRLPRVEAAVAGDGVVLDACNLPGAPGVRLTDFDLAVDLPRFAELGVAVQGEISGVGLENVGGVLCPEAGEIHFAGSIDELATELWLTFVGDGRVVLTLPDGEQVGPLRPALCRDASEGE
jgi:hypothetical protein